MARSSGQSTESLYLPHRKHPQLFADVFPEEFLHPDVILILERARDDNESSSKDDLVSVQALKEEIPGVYSFQCFTSEFLKMFNEEIENFYKQSEKHQIPVHRPNSMNNYGVIVNEIGMRPMISAFQQGVLWPISQRLFPLQGSQFDDHHSFIVRYRADEDLGLDQHIDDSDVTFNVCLGDNNFTGATLTFCGMFGAPDHRKHSFTYHHQVGRAVIHLGTRRHGADDIESGARANLIVWNHNWEWRGSPQYQRRRHSLMYERESGPPDTVCLSYTHDVDYKAYKELPERAKNLQLHPWCPPEGKEYEGFPNPAKVLGVTEKEKKGGSEL